jgi:hypothetical protein
VLDNSFISSGDICSDRMFSRSDSTTRIAWSIIPAAFLRKRLMTRPREFN